MDIPTVDVPMWNADNLCRACVEELNTIKNAEGDAYVNIFEIPDLLNKVSACISNEFCASNKYSKFLCMSCYQHIIAFYEFRRMCIDSIRRFEELLHTGDVMTFEDDRPFSLSSEIDVKEESTDNLPIERYNHLRKDYEEKAQSEIADTRNLKNVKNTNKKTDKSHKKRTIKTTENAQELGHDFNSFANTENEHKSDNAKESGNPDDSEDNMSLASFKDSQDVKTGYKRRSTRNKLKTVNTPASKAIRSKTKNLTIYHCEICPSRFFVEHRLLAHNLEHKGLKPYPCTREGCNKSFTRWSEVSRHLNQHEDNTSFLFVCDEEGCGKVYKYKSALNIHKRKIHKLGPELKSHICETCGKVFKSTTILREHRYTHKDKSERPFSCDQPNCTRRFANKDKLKVHLKRHAGIKNYVCSHCGMRKTTKNELTIHMNYHTLERTWPCRFCSKVCNSAGNLKTHVRTVHERLKEYACRHCDLKFAKPDTRKYHEMRHTGEKPNVCPECGKGFIQPAALRTHMKVHERQQERSVLLMTCENESKINKNC
ncbi:zinc finger protein 391-like [Eurosta solidaginis]|uniref:zinc finger protein 391-like n=1 Tax=Eurosta solidaginis TaxID=178769 RepID=UPI0035316022